MVLAVAVVVAVAWIATSWLLNEVDQAKDPAAARVEAIKTGLSIGAGTGGVFALLLAVRRQWHQEITSIATELDASEKRVTELYTKAVEQLGFDSAVFEGETSFAATKFSDEVSFRAATFRGPANFGKAGFERTVHRLNKCHLTPAFAAAVFESDAIFEDAEGLEATDFIGATFAKDRPAVATTSGSGGLQPTLGED